MTCCDNWSCWAKLSAVASSLRATAPFSNARNAPVRNGVSLLSRSRASRAFKRFTASVDWICSTARLNSYRSLLGSFFTAAANCSSCSAKFPSARASQPATTWKAALLRSFGETRSSAFRARSSCPKRNAAEARFSWLSRSFGSNRAICARHKTVSSRFCFSVASAKM